MGNRIKQTLIIIAITILILTACISSGNPTSGPTTQSTPTPQATQPQLTSREAQVQSVDIQTLNTLTLQVNAIVRGNLTESCAKLGESQVRYESNAIQITVYAVSPSEIGCVQMTTPFDISIPLNLKDLPAGTYTVTANGVKTEFTLPAEDPVSSPVPGATRVPASQTCVDSATFLDDVTIPDNTVVASNTAFTKTWKLKNTGTCTWDSSYLVAYVSGAIMSQQPGYWILQPGQTIVPDQTTDVSVGMTAPVNNGDYVSYWGIKKENGQFLPIQGGVNGISFFVKINVKDGTGEGKVTAQSISIEPEQGSGQTCTANSTYFVHAAISTDGAASVDYELNSTAGQIAAGYFQMSPSGPVFIVLSGTLVFEQAGTKIIDSRFVGPYPYPDNITVNLKVNDGEWYKAKLSCQ